MPRESTQIAKDYLDEVIKKSGYNPDDIYRVIPALSNVRPYYDHFGSYGAVFQLKIFAGHSGLQQLISTRGVEEGIHEAEKYLNDLGERTGLQISRGGTMNHKPRHNGSIGIVLFYLGIKGLNKELTLIVEQMYKKETPSITIHR